MRIAVVGPTHPFKGGVAAHTTELAGRLHRAGHDVDLVSWSRLYPAALYPGRQSVPGGLPDVEPFARTSRPLRWDRPASWRRVGRSLRGHDLVVLVHVVPALAPAHLTIARAAGDGVPVRVVAHNVLPHEPHPGARRLVRSLLTAADAVLVHSAQQADLAAGLGVRDVREVALPPHLPGGPRLPRSDADPDADAGPVRLLSLGLVREYKGVDLLVEAVRREAGAGRDVRLTVAGELWGAAGQRVQRLAAGCDAVQVRPGYVPAGELARLLAAHDVLALPYRSVTASQNVALAFAHGLPVLATRTGTFAADVRDGVDGLLCRPGDVDALAEQVRRLADPVVLHGLRDGVRAPDLDAPWEAYLDRLVH